MDSPIACWRDRVVSRARFLGDIACIARQLPAARFIVNLCEDRYRFLAAFAAVGVNGQTNLLPSSRATLHLQQLAEDYPDSRSVTDQDIEEWVAAGVADNAPPSAPALPVDHLMAVAFTSGSTGRAKPNLKYWGELVSGAQQARQRFGFKAGSTVIATVPPQHMYGLETSIMAPLLSGVCVHASRPFFPEDVRAALADALPSRVLITTPVHLRACVEAQLTWPELAFVISATAPLSLHLAERAEQIFNAPVLEIYGCTEAGSIASRRTLEGEHWLLYDGFQLAGHCLSGAHLPEPTPLSDVIEVCSENRFRLLGRHEDLINLAGKRSSLAYLNHQINQIDGVAEGVFVLPDETTMAMQRLAAVVVAPKLSERQLLAALAERLDPVFLPRPLIRVAELPRNETGKITRDALLALINNPSSSARSRHD
ncbi:MAG: acyl-CoA synthetase [Candidatus Competibacteraceae bacterium]|nr:acyl-CoA synthetase [Candidatus Competibacteraceae bacterium]